MKRFIQGTLHRVANSGLAVMLYKVCSKLGEVLVRMASMAKARATFPSATNLSLDVRTDIKYPHNISIGQGVIIGSGSVIGAMAPVSIGDLVRISRNVTIETATLDFSTSLPYQHIAKSIQIGRGVWLGSGVTVLGGVTIGDYAIIGAGAVVAKDVPTGAIIVGSANRHIRSLPESLK